MAKFKLEKRIDLSELGEGWAECYLLFTAPSFKDIKQISKLSTETGEAEAVDKAVDVLKCLYVSGEGFSDNGKVKIEKDDLEDLPVEVLTRCFQEISGAPDPK